MKQAWQAYYSVEVLTQLTAIYSNVIFLNLLKNKWVVLQFIIVLLISDNAFFSLWRLFRDAQQSAATTCRAIVLFTQNVISISSDTAAHLGRRGFFNPVLSDISPADMYNKNFMILIPRKHSYHCGFTPWCFFFQRNHCIEKKRNKPWMWSLTVCRTPPQVTYFKFGTSYLCLDVLILGSYLDKYVWKGCILYTFLILKYVVDWGWCLDNCRSIEV